MLDPLGAGVIGVVICLMWALGTELQPSLGEPYMLVIIEPSLQPLI